MTLKVVFRKAARAEFDAAALWYKARQASLGPRFVAEIDRAVELAAANPNRFPVKHTPKPNA
jgi:plasmid stabilization system protein ParE